MIDIIIIIVIIVCMTANSPAEQGKLTLLTWEHLCQGGVG